MNNKKVIISIIIFSIICIISATAWIISIASNVDMKTANVDKSIVENNNTNYSITDIKNNIEPDKIFYMESEATYAYEPTLENLYEKSDIVLIGSFNSNLKTYAPGVTIHTITKFDTSKVLKNNTNINVNKTVTFDRIGGALKLSEYINGNDTIRPDEFVDIPAQARNEYYVIQEYDPNDKLDLKTEKNQASKSVPNQEYILFLSERNNQLVVNSYYHGMREIKDNKLYDYNTKSFIASNLITK